MTDGETPVLAATLLAEACTAHPELAALTWQVTKNSATTDLGQFAGMRTEGTTLIVTPAPDALPLVNTLHAAGWKRDGSQEFDRTWRLAAELTRGGATIQVHGTTHTPPANRHDAIPYFADLPPELPARMSRKFKDEWAEWERKCHQADW